MMFTKAGGGMDGRRVLESTSSISSTSSNNSSTSITPAATRVSVAKSISSDNSPPSDPHLIVGLENDGDYKVCKICGDKALGYNFNVISCESCKAFFRRNANKSKNFRCPSNNMCTITVISRRFCQRCRLKRCFDAGMNKELVNMSAFQEGMKKEWIMTDDALVERRQRHVEKKHDPTLRVPLVSEMNYHIRRRSSYSIDPNGSTGGPDGPPPMRRIYLGPPSVGVDDRYPIFRNPNSYLPELANPAGVEFGHSRPPTLPPWHSALVQQPPLPHPVGLVPRPRLLEPQPHPPPPLPLPLPIDGTTMTIAPRSQFGVQVPLASTGPPTAPYMPTMLPTQPYNPAIADHQRQQQQPRQVHAPSSTLLTSDAPPGPPIVPIEAQIHRIRDEEPPQFEDAITAHHNKPDYIYVPKAVLANLVNQCYSMLQQRSATDAVAAAAAAAAAVTAKSAAGDQSPILPSPILARMAQWTKEAITGQHHPPLDCICQCVCGAKLVGAAIGMEKVDKCLGTDEKTTATKGDDSLRHALVERSPREPEDETVHSSCGKAEAKSSAAWLSLDEQDSYVWNGSPLSASQSASALPGMSLFMWLRMEELIAANQIMNEPADFALLNRSSADSALQDSSAAVDLTMMTNVCVRRIIRMCKRIGAFKNLCQDDQIALLKGSCTEILVLRGVMAYNAETDAYDVSWYPTPNGRVKLDVLKGIKGNCYEEHRKFLRSFEDVWRRDERIMLVLGALTLFNPKRKSILHEKVVRREYEFYLKMLKNYLEITFDSQEAQIYYLALCDRLETLRECVHEYAATIFLDVNPRDLEPLLLEVFDLQDYHHQAPVE